MAAEIVQRRVLIVADLGSDSDAKFINLPDPGTGTSSTYLLTHSQLLECNVYRQRYASWFLGDAVASDGTLHFATPIDPLFIIIPALERARSAGNFCDLEQCLECLHNGDGVHYGPSLNHLFQGQALECICDVKNVGSQRYYKLNDAKALSWLKRKVSVIKSALVSGASAAAFGGMDDTALTAYATGLLGEYVSAAWQAKLRTAFDLADVPNEQITEQLAAYTDAFDETIDASTSIKRQRLDPKEAARAKAAESRAVSKAAKLAKDAAGMRKLSTFFTKKP